MTPSEWYRRNYPQGPDHNERCLNVIAEMEPAMYNLHPVGEHRPDGGFRQCGDGLAVHLRPGASLSSFDHDDLTRLLVAAHRHACRVDVRAQAGKLVIQVNPRNHDGASLYSRHPSLDDLIAECSGAAESSGAPKGAG